MDFINTVEGASTDHERDMFGSYPAVALWSLARGIIDKERHDEFVRRAQVDPASAERAWEAAITLRAALRAITGSICDGADPEHALAGLNDSLATLPSGPSLAPAADSGISLILAADCLDSLLWPVMHSAITLLTSDDARKLGECHALNCNAIFIDPTRGRRRQWCSEEGCGNRERVRRHYNTSRRRPTPEN